jgi:methionyl-tRNA formyltransferase
MADDFKNLRIVFMGTPEFAVASLDELVKAGCNIVAVVTAPDKAAGRGMQLQQSPVKKYAVEHNLKIFQPEKLKDPDFLNELQLLKADLQIVVAFRMLPEAVWNLPPMGTINLHGSLLPQYRGAAPVNWVIINGEKETGVTTFKLKHEIDTGDILLQETISVGENETAGELHDKMKEIGAKLLVKTIKELADGTLKETSQSSVVSRESSETDSPPSTHDSRLLKHAPKLHTDNCRINWSDTVQNVHNLIRGLSPYPGAFTIINDKMFKIFRTKKEIVFPKGTEGDHETDGKTYLKFACSDGYLHVLEVQMEGKKKMMIEEFLRGFRSNSSQ